MPCVFTMPDQRTSLETHGCASENNLIQKNTKVFNKTQSLTSLQQFVVLIVCQFGLRIYITFAISGQPKFISVIQS
jgi:dihydroorotase